MRNTFAKQLTQLAHDDDKVMLLSGDIGNRLFDEFKSSHFDRFINCGIAEQNMTGFAAGLAMQGFKPFTYTIAPFCTTRCLEQIRTDIAYHQLPVTIVSVGAGLSYAGLGPSHQAMEDISFLRSIPNMNVFCPGDSRELETVLRITKELNAPCYVRMGKKGEPLVHQKPIINYEIGKPIKLFAGESVCLLSTGTILPEAVQSIDLLQNSNINASLYSFPTVKPLCNEALSDIFEKYEHIITIEEHSLIGGFGSTIAEWKIDSKYQSKGNLLRIGAPDDFFKQAGSQKFAREHMGLDKTNIHKQILAFVNGASNEN